MIVPGCGCVTCLARTGVGVKSAGSSGLGPGATRQEFQIRPSAGLSQRKQTYNVLFIQTSSSETHCAYTEIFMKHSLTR